MSAEHIYVEGYSGDRDWQCLLRACDAPRRTTRVENVVIITSEFQMERTRAIYGCHG